MNAARANAKRLVEDARRLLDKGCHASAAALAILAIEEAGKVSILRALSVARDDQDMKETWRDYRSHAKKNMAWILPQLAAQGARDL